MDKIEREDKRHDKHLLKIREEALQDFHLGYVEKAVIGFTGSLKKLAHYQNLQQKIRDNNGKPFITTGYSHGGDKIEVAGGLISDEIDVDFRYDLNDSKREQHPIGATLRVPVLPVFSYYIFIDDSHLSKRS